MMSLLPIVERLRAACPELMIEEPTGLLALEREDLPAATVIPLGDSTSEGLTIAGLTQDITARFAVLIAAEMADSRIARDPLAEARTAVAAALNGWQATDWLRYAVRTGGAPQEYHARRVLWRDEYEVHLRAVHTITHET